MMLPGAQLQNRLTAPSTVLALGLAVAVGLVLLPASCSGTLKGAAGALLRPGQLGMLELRERGGRVVALVKTHFHSAAKLAECQRRRMQLERDNRRLAAELAFVRSQRRSPSGRAPRADDAPQPLLSTRCVRARVLGHQARAFLADCHLLDVGSRSGVRVDALVVDSPLALIDQGSDAQLEPEQLVLSRGRIWGKIIEVGPLTSSVRTVTQPGYRDLVELADPDAEGSALGAGPQGLLEGTGEPLARVRLVEVTEPVAVGDAVYTAASEGLLPEPLLYGHVVRLRRPVGAAHWEIWMKPAVAPGDPKHVAVLRTVLNPLRVARQEASTASRQ